MQVKPTRIVELTTPRGRNLKVLARTHPRARYMRLTFDVDGPRLSTPRGTPTAQINDFLRANAAWLDARLREYERQGVRTTRPVPGVPDTLMWRGRLHLVRWEACSFPSVRAETGVVTIALDLEHPEVEQIARRAIGHFIATQTQREVLRIVEKLTPQVGRPLHAVRIKPLRTLWGSLSVGSTMTLDLALALAPPFALEYVVAHELTHLRVRDHSPRFWSRCAELYPRTDEARDWLSDYGHTVKAELSRWLGPRQA
jgi:predicted metal-dependent hydrolase